MGSPREAGVQWWRIPPVLPAFRWSCSTGVTRLLAAALICAAPATPASADVTLQRKVRGQMLGTVAEDATEYRKGLKLRTDSTSNVVSMSTIIDLSKGRMIMLWHHSKTADVFEPKQISELFWKDNVPRSSRRSRQRLSRVKSPGGRASFITSRRRTPWRSWT